MNPPSVNLQPGQTSPDVYQLQQWLIHQGYSIPDGPTNYFGAETKAALTKWQSDHGVDTAGNPGYYGPRTMSVALKPASTTTPTKSPTSAPTPTKTPATPAPVSPQKALLSAVADVATTAAATGKPPVTFAEALALAAKDPDIVNKYSDMAKLDKQSFMQALDQLKTATSIEQKDLATKFRQERQQLAESSAAAGRAYSGFRGQAQKDLAQNESGIVESSRAKIKSDLNAMTSAFEAKYGTGATPNTSISFANPLNNAGETLAGLKAPVGGSETISGETAGGIVGSVAPAKAADIRSSAASSYQTAQFPSI